MTESGPTARPRASVAIAFGSNIGERERNIALALGRLGTFVDITAVSGLYETAPLYKPDQPSFLNGALVGSTTYDPVRLLAALKEAERAVGRVPRVRNGPREIDLDLVDFNGTESTREGLDLPHPRAHERRFVLEPLNEIAPDLLLAGYGRVRELLSRTDVQSQDVRRIGDAPVPIPSG